MRVLRYFWFGGKLLFYIAFGALISLFMALILRDLGGFLLFCRLFALSFSLIMLLRISDDYFDYEKDGAKKEQPLKKRELLIILISVAAVYTAVNVCFYSLYGLCGLIILLYLFAQQKAEVLKVFFMPLASACYFYLNRTADMLFLPIGGYLLVCLILSALFYLMKRRRKTE